MYDFIPKLPNNSLACTTQRSPGEVAAWYWRELRFACLSHEPACENYLDYAYSVIDGQFFNDELVTLKL